MLLPNDDFADFTPQLTVRFAQLLDHLQVAGGNIVGARGMNRGDGDISRLRHLAGNLTAPCLSFHCPLPREKVMRSVSGGKSCGTSTNTVTGWKSAKGSIF